MRTKSLAVAALFMALVMVTTAFVKIPLPLTGYIHLGDTFIFLACFFLKKPYAIAASAMGSALADVIAFPVYAPASCKICVACKVVGIFAPSPTSVTPFLTRIFADSSSNSFCVAQGRATLQGIVQMPLQPS